MRNLKKVLALVLCLVMALSLVTVAGAVDSVATKYADADKIGEAYMEAAEVLNGLGVFQGTGEGFDPDGTFTRAQLAGLMYRLVANDPLVDGADKHDRYKAGAAGYTDVPDNWATGYIGYCTYMGLVSGVGDNKFAPDRAVTGYEVLTAMLHLIGYTEGFDGADYWAKSLAQIIKLGLDDTIVDMDKLANPATRQGVSDMVFHVLTEAPMVKYNTTTKSYDDVTDADGEVVTLGTKNFELARSASPASANEWKAPAISWKQGSTTLGDPTPVKVTKQYTGETAYKTIATDLKLSDDGEEFEVYVDGGSATKVQVKKSNTDTVGGNGSKVDVYYEVSDGEVIVARIVVINEFLAKVTEASGKKLKLDIYMDSTKSVEVYDAEDVDYVKGDMLVVKAAGGANKYKADSTGKAIDDNKQNLEIIGLADYVVAKQTSPVLKGSVVTKRTVDGKTYENQATITGNTDNQTDKYYWYFGSDGKYIIGAALYTEDGAVTTDTKYGYITSISAALDADTKGADVAVVYTDGTKETIKVKSFTVRTDAATPNADITDSNTMTLIPLYDTDRSHATKPDSEKVYLQLYPVAGVNAEGDNAADYVATVKGKGINLFKFEANKKGGYDAYQVSGDGSPEDEDLEVFKGLYSGAADSSNKTLNQKYGLLTLASGGPVRVGDSTKIIVKDKKEGTVKIWNGLSALTGDVTLETGASVKEVDWVKAANATYASVVVLTGEVDKGNTASTYSYGLFYFNGKTADLSTNEDDDVIYSLEGRLNGAAKTLTFGETDGKYVLNSVSRYPGHLFAVKVDADGVASLLKNGSSSAYLVATKGAEVVLDSAVSAFEFGTKNGNSYSDTSGSTVTKMTYSTAVQGAGAYDADTGVLTLKDNNNANMTFQTDAVKTTVGSLASLKLATSSITNPTTYNITVVYDVVGSTRMAREIYMEAVVSGSSAAGTGNNYSDLKLDYLPKEYEQVIAATFTGGTAANAYAASIDAQLAAGNNVVAFGDLDATSDVTITVPKGQELVIRGTVNGSQKKTTIVLEDKTSVLVVTGKYTTTNKVDTLKGTIVAGEVELTKPGTANASAPNSSNVDKYKITIAADAQLVTKKVGTTTNGDLTIVTDVDYVENKGLISVEGTLTIAGSTEVTNAKTATMDTLTASSATWVEKSSNTLTVKKTAGLNKLAIKEGTVNVAQTVTLGNVADALKMDDGKLVITNGDLLLGTGNATATVSKGTVELLGAGKSITTSSGNGGTLTIKGSGSVTAPKLTALATVNVGDSTTKGALTVTEQLGNGSNATAVVIAAKGAATVEAGSVKGSVTVTATSGGTLSLGGGVDVSANEVLKAYAGEDGKISLDGVDLKANKSNTLVDPEDTTTAKNDFRIATVSYDKDANATKFKTWLAAQGMSDNDINAVTDSWASSASTDWEWGNKNTGREPGNLFVFIDASNLASEFSGLSSTARMTYTLTMDSDPEKRITFKNGSAGTPIGWNITESNPDLIDVLGLVAVDTAALAEQGAQHEYVWNDTTKGQECTLTLTLKLSNQKTFSASTKVTLPLAGDPAASPSD